jgi:mannosylglycoprotein endo-beta-mannosidase
VFAAIDRIKWATVDSRQWSQLTWIKVGSGGDTKLFHLRANGQRRKNHITYLHAGNPVVSEQADVLLHHLNCLLGNPDEQSADMWWDNLRLPQVDLSHLDQPFELEELKAEIKCLTAEKAPRLYGFIGMFYKRCWHTDEMDLPNALNQMSALIGKNWKLLNTAYIALIPKKDIALGPTDFRQISLSHSIAKILRKLLATRLAPYMKSLVCNSQS